MNAAVIPIVATARTRRSSRPISAPASGLETGQLALAASAPPPLNRSSPGFRWTPDPLTPLDQRLQETAQPLTGLLIHEVARLRVELLAREGDEHLRLGHNVGRRMQEYLPQHHLSPGGAPPPGLAPRSRLACA